jgi:hypothetical protein
VPVTTSKDRFEAIVKALGEMQAEHRMRGELLQVVSGLSRGRFRTDGRTDDGRGGVRVLDAL